MAIAVAEAPLSLPDLRVRSLAPVRTWIFVLAALVVAMVAVGGATRLTGSGLSITEWRPVTGAIPPLSEAAWMAEFEKYRAIPQYQLLNRGMSLSEFKVIYAWEWGHRQLGRLLGLAFFIPLVWFWAKGLVTRASR
jgi:cytochrome c oxidase assembly protein subunit 15